LTGKEGTAGAGSAKILPGYPAEESEHAGLVEAMGFDREMDEQGLKRWSC
jgi:hypothetical protein